MKIYDKEFFELAKKNGIEASELYYGRSYSLKVEVFHKEIASFVTNDSSSLDARGIVNGKFGSVSTEAINSKTPAFLVNGIKETAKVIEKDDPSIIFKGSEKYHKKNLYNPKVLEGNLQDKINNLMIIEEKLRAYDPRIVEVQGVEYEEGLGETILANSYGLKLKTKSADYAYVASVVAKEGNEVKTGFKVFASRNPDEFDLDKFVKEAAEDALHKLGSTQCVSKKYPIILNPKTAGYLTKFYLNSAIAEEVQKRSSLFVGKLHQQVASKKVSILENPLIPNLNFRYFDEEGVATSKKDVIKNGILETYFYNLASAAKDGVESTGNGYRFGAKMGTSYVNLMIKPGRKSEEELIGSIKEGVYISDVQGLHAGMNAQSGNFSLQAEGFMIRDGKLAEPLSLITLAGNLMDMFMNVDSVANNLDLNDCIFSGVLTPSLKIKKMSVTGK